MTTSNRRVYLDNAASTPMDPAVFEYMRPFFCEWTGNPSSTHAHGRVLRSAMEEARRTIAGHIGALPGEVIFTSGGTEADNLAIWGAYFGQGIRHIVTTHIEHHAVGHVIEEMQAKGLVTVTYLTLDRQGRIDTEELRTVLASHPNSLVSLMHGNNELGTLYDLNAIGQVCREFGALFHSDTVQTMGHIPLNMKEMPVDFITASAHKFYGPKGVGFLYVRKGVKITPHLRGGSQERNLRAGTENVPSIAGMAYALDKCYRNLQEKNDHLRDLKYYMKQGLETRFRGVHFNGCIDPDQSLPTVLNVSFDCEDDCMLLFNLDLAGVSASGGSACSAGADIGSHVLHEIGVSPAHQRSSVRFSFGVQNTRDDIDFALAQLEQVVRTPVA